LSVEDNKKKKVRKSEKKKLMAEVWEEEWREAKQENYIKKFKDWAKGLELKESK